MEKAAKILTPLAVLFGLAVAWKRAKLLEQGQVTERFTRATEMLGEEKRTVRLGAIYSLERIAKDSKTDRGTIVEVLCAFVRDWKTREKDEEPTKRPGYIVSGAGGDCRSPATAVVDGYYGSHNRPG